MNSKIKKTKTKWVQIWYENKNNGHTDFKEFKLPDNAGVILDKKVIEK